MDGASGCWLLHLSLLIDDIIDGEIGLCVTEVWKVINCLIATDESNLLAEREALP